MIIANKNSSRDDTSITDLGDSLGECASWGQLSVPSVCLFFVSPSGSMYVCLLAAQGELCGAHLCYYLSGLQLGSYGDTLCKYSLLGEDHTR